VANPTAAGNVTVYPNGVARPLASNVNFANSGAVPNLVMAKLGAGGAVLIYNNSGRPLSVIADVAGYYLASPLNVPTGGVSRYVRNLDATASDATNAATMQAEGAADAVANGTGQHVVLLDIGAQTITAPLSPGHPGVLLTSTSTRLTYAQLTAALAGYLTGYSANRGSGTAIVAIATNSEGDFTSYAADARGLAWSDSVVRPLQDLGTAGISVVGANDIEAGFAASFQQALGWETAYLAGSATGQLVFAGSADACPATYGVTAAACGAVLVDGGPTSQTWTQANYWALAHGVSVSRLVALPQIYLPVQAAQWANIAARGNASDRFNFLGALTEVAACPSAGGGCPSASLPPAQGWAALKLALAGYAVTADSIPTYSTDLKIG
jgi:hypothetical protein